MFIAILAALIFFAILLTISLLVTCGIIWLICWCFNITFVLKIAIGIWLILLLLGGTFKTVVKKEK